MEPSYRRHAKHEKAVCKHCKSPSHSSLEHRKHYPNFREEKKAKRMEKHMKMFEPERSEESAPTAKKHRKHMTVAEDTAFDKKHGIKENSPEDRRMDRLHGVHDKHRKGFTVKHTGKFEGKSNALGHGGRAAQMRAHGVPGAVIGAIARREGAAPGGPNYHGKHRKGIPASASPFDTSNGSSAAGRTAGALSNFGRASMGSRGSVGGNSDSTTAMAPKFKHAKRSKKE